MLNKDEIAALLSVGEKTPVENDTRLAGIIALSAEMGEPPDRDAPVREVPARLGDNWSALILMVLRTGTFRHAALKRMIGALSFEGEITQRMLTLRLRALERDGFVARHAHPSVPPRVEYALTPLGADLADLYRGVLGWIKAHETQIQSARDAFDPEP